MWNTWFKPKPIKLLEEALYAFEAKHDYPFIGIVKPAILARIASDPSGFAKAITEQGLTPAQVVATEIANIAGDMLETGQHCIYRGVLSDSGKQLLRVYSDALDDLVLMGAITDETRKTELAGLHRSIRRVG